MVSLYRVARITWVIVLSVAFFTLFGYPALQRFREGAVLLKVSKINPSSVFPPAITLCPFPHGGQTGWKNGTLELEGSNAHYLETQCRNTSSQQEIKNCFQQKTFTLEESVLGRIIKMITSWG